MPHHQNFVDKLTSRLPEDGRTLVEEIRSRGESSGLRAFLVGGTVRDELLGRDSLDVDIVLEGDAVRLARSLASIPGIRLAKTTAFGTANLKAGAFSLDLATARAETYAKPGALPRVRPSTIDDDLHRRDFTINAIAVQITAPAAGKFLDPTGGVSDLRAGLVRVLHDGSFQDDATRIIRAARYEARFGFRLEERTLELLQRDGGYLRTISGTRLRQELSRTFTEARPWQALLRLQELGVFPAIHSAISFDETQAEALRRLEELRAPSLSMWPVLLWTATPAADVIRRLALTRPQAQAVAAIEEARDAAPRLTLRSRPSQVAKLVYPLPLATAFALAAMTGDRRIAEYVTSGRNLRPLLRGDDVIRAGVPAGPDVARVLGMLRAAKLDGEVVSKADEERLVEEFLARERIGLA